jgi:hypothetical protein
MKDLTPILEKEMNKFSIMICMIFAFIIKVNAEKVVFNTGNEFVFLNTSDKKLLKLTIPKEIATDYSIKDRFICYFAVDGVLYQYDMEKKTNTKIVDFSILKKDGIAIKEGNLVGPGLMAEIDFNPYTEEYAFIIGASYVYIDEKRSRKISFSEISERDYVYYNKKQNRALCSSQSGEYWRPILTSKCNVIIHTPAGPILFNGISKKENALYKEIYNLKEGRDLFPEYFLFNEKLILFEIDNLKKYYRTKIWEISRLSSINLKKLSYEIVNNGKNNALFRLEPGEWIEDLNVPIKSVLISKEKKVLFLYNYEKNEKRKLIDIKSKIGKACFWPLGTGEQGTDYQNAKR